MSAESNVLPRSSWRMISPVLFLSSRRVIRSPFSQRRNGATLGKWLSASGIA